MKPIDQDAFGIPDGNCFTACVACLLQVELDDVRDLEEIHREGARAFEDEEEDENQVAHWHAVLERYNDRLAERYGVRIAYLEPEAAEAPLGYSIASGHSPRGEWGHCVVAFNGKIIHDPHPSRDGFNGPPLNYGFLVAVVPLP
jgi:hypothetical protein